MGFHTRVLEPRASRSLLEAEVIEARGEALAARMVADGLLAFAGQGFEQGAARHRIGRGAEVQKVEGMAGRRPG